jgi:hypothetical protein
MRLRKIFGDIYIRKTLIDSKCLMAITELFMKWVTPSINIFKKNNICVE